MSTLQFASMRREDRRNLQAAINEKGGQRLTPDGAFGPKSVQALRAYQLKIGITPTGLFDDPTQAILTPFINEKYVVAKDYVAASKQLGCETASVRAVVEVEAKSCGFLPDGRVLILFERHKFYSALMNKRPASDVIKIAGSYPDICNAKTGGYLGEEREWPRIEKAITIDETAALASASYGLFQIMGFNYKAAGFPDVKSYVEAMKVSERNHLKAFVNFIQADVNLLRALRNKDWKAFARAYNGSEYWKHEYDTRMATAYDRNIPFNTLAV